MYYHELKLFPCRLQLGSNPKYAVFYNPFIYFHKLSWFFCKIFVLTTLKNPWQQKAWISLHWYWIKTHIHLSLLEYTQYWLRSRPPHTAKLLQLIPSPFNVNNLAQRIQMKFMWDFASWRERVEPILHWHILTLVFLDIHKFKMHTHQLLVFRYVKVSGLNIMERNMTVLAFKTWLKKKKKSNIFVRHLFIMYHTLWIQTNMNLLPAKVSCQKTFDTEYEKWAGGLCGC